MRKYIENIIKKYTVINRLYTLVGSFIFKLLGLMIKKKDKTILFVSFMGKNYNDSPKALYDRMIGDPFFDDFHFVWAFKDVDKFSVKERTTKVEIDSFEYFKYALSAEYWVTNVNIERGTHFKKKYTKYINTWHGIPLKKVGNDVKGRKDFDFSSVDLFSYSGTFEAKIYKRSFNLSENNMYKYGMPRNDIVLSGSPEITSKIREKYSIPHDKKILLYAPTWREGNSSYKPIDFNEWISELKENFVVLVKGHGLTGSLVNSDNKFAIDVTNYEETSHLILASDILITDYSSIMFDYALTQKPIYIYIPDLNEYKKSRGLYFDLKETELKLYFEQSKLVSDIIKDAQSDSYKISKKFISDYNEVLEATATNNIIEWIKKN